MALKLGEVHSEDTRSFFMESSRPTGNPLSVHRHKHAAGKLRKGGG